MWQRCLNTSNTQQYFNLEMLRKGLWWVLSNTGGCHNPQGWSAHPLCSGIFFILCEGSDAGHRCFVSLSGSVTCYALISQTDKQLSLSLMLLHFCCSYCNRPLLAPSNINLFTEKYQPSHSADVFFNMQVGFGRQYFQVIFPRNYKGMDSFWAKMIKKYQKKGKEISKFPSNMLLS